MKSDPIVSQHKKCFKLRDYNEYIVQIRKLKGYRVEFH